MVGKKEAEVTSVTPQLRFQRLTHSRKFWLVARAVEWAAGGEDPHILRAAEAQLKTQKRRDASMPSAAVHELLLSAAERGMTQKDFELTAANLRPSTGKDNGGFNGRLWHHYLANDARMRCETFLEYLQAFLKAGWLDEDAARPLAKRALAVLIATESGADPIRAKELLVARFLMRTLGLSRRRAARAIRSLRDAAPQEDNEAYLNILDELPARFAGLEALGKQLEKQKQHQMQDKPADTGGARHGTFGTNLSH